jgi:hypothetical protein
MQSEKGLYATEKLWTGMSFSSAVSSVKTPLEDFCAHGRIYITICESVIIRFYWFMNGPVVVIFHNFNFLLLILNLYQSSTEMLWQ